MTPAEIIAEVRRCGGEFVTHEDGTHGLRGSTGLPASLLAIARENSRAIKNALALESVDQARAVQRGGALLAEYKAAKPNPNGKNQHEVKGAQPSSTSRQPVTQRQAAKAAGLSWERQDARFNALLAEYGIDVDEPKRRPRRVA